MPSEKQRRQQREAQRRKRELRREHARLALLLLAEELDQPSLSGLLIAFAEPLRRLLPQGADRARYEELLHVAALVWNAAQAFEGERLEEGLQGAAARLARLTGAGSGAARAALRGLARRRRTRHAHEPRYIGGVEVLEEGAGDWRVLVVSRHLPPALRADGSGDEELRPSSLLDAAHGGHLIV